MQATLEQRRIIETDAPLVVVRAVAGAGKTSTLIEFAKYRRTKRILYLVLTKSVQTEAEHKFRGTLVKPLTSHALAYRHTGAQYRHKLVKGIKPYEIEKALVLGRELQTEPEYTGNRNNDLVVSSIVIDTLQKFLYSTDKEILGKHVGENTSKLRKMFGDLSGSKINEIVVAQAKHLWEMMTDPENPRVGMLHDGYLKLYQLSEPVLSEYDVIMVDEAQDMNPVSLSIVFRQKASKVLVGDDGQAIFAWRGAKNALGFAIRQGGVAFNLTGSFRFGPNVASVANAIMSIKGHALKVQGLLPGDRIGAIPDGEKRTVISRTNADVFSQTAYAMHDNLSWWHVGGSEGYRFDQILDIYYLWKRSFERIRDPFIRTFTDFAELKTYAEDVEDVEIKPRCRIVEEYKDCIPVIIDNITQRVGAAMDMKCANLVLSTCHKAKGLEWPHVQIDNDFIELCEIPDLSKLNEIDRLETLKKINEDLNILYVAVTRAKKVLQLNLDLMTYLRREAAE